MPTVDLTGIVSKLERAQHHWFNLHEVLSPVLEHDPSHFRVEAEHAGTKLVYYPSAIPRVEAAWSVISGDCLTNLRAVLDHLAWQLVLLDGGTPCRATQFPILSRVPPAGLQLRPRIQDGAILTAVDAVQPYKRGEGASARNHQLWTLHDLVNIDKHRLLVLVELVLDWQRVWWGTAEGTPSPAPWISSSPLRVDEPAATFDFHGQAPPSDFDAHLRATVRFDHGEPGDRLRQLTVLEILGGIGAYLSFVLNRNFGPLFGGTPFDSLFPDWPPGPRLPND